MSDELSRLLHRAAENVPDRPDRYQRVQARRAGLARRRRRAAALAGVAVLIAAGSVVTLTLDTPQESLVPSTDAPALTTAPRPTYEPVDAATACPPVPMVRVTPEMAGATRAYICSTDMRAVPGEGTWTFDIVKGVTGGLDELLTAWAGPDDYANLSPNTACPAVAYAPLKVWLDGPTALPVTGPTGGCGWPTPAAQTAFDALTTVVVSETRAHQVSTHLAETSGCTDRYKDMMLLLATGTVPRSTREAPRPLEPGTLMCVYQAQADADGDRVGQLTAARPLTPEQIARFNSLLAQATPGRGCSITEHTRFALLTSRGEETQVALDGCALKQGSTVWRTTERLRAALG